MPLGFVWMSLFVLTFWLFLRGNRLESLLTIGLFALIAVAFNGTLASKLTSAIEKPRTELYSDDAPPYRALLLLGGSVDKAYDGVVELTSEGQRVVLAAQYWHAGRVQAIVCTGGQAVTENEPHSRNVRGMLESLNVPADVIFEIGGRNTKGEMQALVTFFGEPPANLSSQGRVGLITSAFHMERAMRLADEAGLNRAVDLVPLPCCYRRRADYGFTPRMFLPHANSGDAFAIALKERLAAIAGR